MCVLQQINFHRFHQLTNKQLINDVHFLSHTHTHTNREEINFPENADNCFPVKKAEQRANKKASSEAFIQSFINKSDNENFFLLEINSKFKLNAWDD